MADKKRVTISMPDGVLNETEEYISPKPGSIMDFVAKRKKCKVQRQMARGYASMGKINTTLAETDCESDYEDFLKYETQLAESE